MPKSDIGAFYGRDCLEEFARDILGESDPGLMVSIERVSELHSQLTQQVLGELSKYIQDGVLAQFNSFPSSAKKERQAMRECVIAALLLRRRVSGVGSSNLIPLGYGPLKESSC